MFDKVDIAFLAFFLLMLVIGIFRISILDKKYGKNKSYLISSLLALFLTLPCALYGLYEANKLYENINVRLYAVLLITAVLGNIFFALYLVKFKAKK